MRLEQRHRAGMAERMCAYTRCRQGRAALFGGNGVSRDTALDGVAGQAPSSAGGEQWVLGLALTLIEPDGENGLGVFGERHGALLAAFAVDAEVGSGAE